MAARKTKTKNPAVTKTAEMTKPAPASATTFEEVVKAATDVEAAADAVMRFIDESYWASPSVSRSSSIEFYKCIAETCNERVDQITTENDEEAG